MFGRFILIMIIYFIAMTPIALFVNAIENSTEQANKRRAKARADGRKPFDDYYDSSHYYDFVDMGADGDGGGE